MHDRHFSYFVTAAILAIALFPSPGLAAGDLPDDPSFCPVAIDFVQAVDSAGTVQAIGMRPVVNVTAAISGTIALFTSENERFDVRFQNVGVAPNVVRSPIAYRFRTPVTITGAFVASLDTPTPGPCAPSYPWLRNRPGSVAKPYALSNDLRDAAQPVAAAPTSAPMACATPYAQAATDKVAQAYVGTLDTHPHGQIFVLVTVNMRGDVLDATVARMSPAIAADNDRVPLQQSAIRSARESHYVPEIFRCAPAIGAYYFVAQF